MRCASWGVSGSTLRAQMRSVRSARVDDRQEPARRLHLDRELLMLLAQGRELCLAQQFFAKRLLVLSELPIDVRNRHRPLLHILDVALQEVVNRLDANPD